MKTIRVTCLLISYLKDVVRLWSGDIDSARGALQLLLLVDYICDWGRDKFRESTIRSLAALSGSDREGTVESEIFSLRGVANAVTDPDAGGMRSLLRQERGATPRREHPHPPQHNIQPRQVQLNVRPPELPPPLPNRCPRRPCLQQPLSRSDFQRSSRSPRRTSRRPRLRDERVAGHDPHAPELAAHHSAERAARPVQREVIMRAAGVGVRGEVVSMNCEERTRDSRERTS